MFKRKFILTTSELDRKIAFLKKQIIEGEQFLKMDKEKLEKKPGSIGLKLALSSMEGILSKLRMELGDALEEQKSYYKEIETWPTWNDHLFPFNGLNDHFTIYFSDSISKFRAGEEFYIAKSRQKFTSISESYFPVFSMEQSLFTIRNDFLQKFEFLQTQPIVETSQKIELKVEGCANEELLSAA